MMTYSQACADPNLFGPWFVGESWDAWRVVDRALFSEPLDAHQLAIFRDLTGRSEPPPGPVEEAWFVVGRRGGKDVKAASIAAYIATVGNEAHNYRRHLTRGERGVVQLLAVDREQARVCLGYLRAMFEQPILRRLVERDTPDGIDLRNRLAIEITTNDRRRVRGRTVIAAIFDEVAFWMSEGSANPDEEVYRAVRPAMATIPGAMLIGISSPYARRGLLWKKHRRHYGQDDPRVLVVQAPTWTMNPTIPRDGRLLTEAFEEDPASAAAEYGAQFRTDVETFVSREAVEACVDTGVRERPRARGRQHTAFVDPSGGSSDSMTLAIAHADDAGRPVLDAVREVRPPFSPEAVVDEFAALLRSYGISRVRGDRYAGEWPREQFRRRGIEYDLSDRPKSALYGALLPALNSGSVVLLDHPRLVAQIVGLERRTARGGRDSIDHPPGGHDDLANAAAGALVEIAPARRGRAGVLFPREVEARAPRIEYRPHPAGGRYPVVV